MIRSFALVSIRERADVSELIDFGGDMRTRSFSSVAPVNTAPNPCRNYEIKFSPVTYISDIVSFIMIVSSILSRLPVIINGQREKSMLKVFQQGDSVYHSEGDKSVRMGRAVVISYFRMAQDSHNSW